MTDELTTAEIRAVLDSLEHEHPDEFEAAQAGRAEQRQEAERQADQAARQTITDAIQRRDFNSYLRAKREATGVNDNPASRNPNWLQ